MTREQAIDEMLRRRDRMDAAQLDAEHARNAFHQALRRAHCLGVTMRDLASSLGMSHQRVHQLVGDDVALQVVRRLARTEPDEARQRVLRLVSSDDDAPGSAASEAFAQAAVEAASLGPHHLGTEHVLLALLRGGPTADILGGMGVTYDDAREEVIALLGAGPPRDESPPDFAATRAVGRILANIPETTRALLAALLDRAKDDDPLPAQDDLVRCSFCGTSQKSCKKLIAGPRVYICDVCTSAAHPNGAADRCSFCNQAAKKVRWLYEAGNAAICDECIDLCNDILKAE